MTGSHPRPAVDRGSAGFTLIELLVSLALFALISLAGIGLVETIVGVQQRMEGRSERLAELQRALYLVTADFEQLTSGPERDGNRVTLTRGSANGPYSVAYSIAGGALHRAANGLDRPLVGDVRAVNWRFFKNGAWVDQPTTEDDESRPRGVELTVDLAPRPNRIGGSLRKVIELPVAP